MKAVIQAGGKGTRLRPYTLVLPKPLMPVGGISVIEMLLKWLRRNGVEEVYITINYLEHLIRAMCGDGNQWGMRITYHEEPEPLGTIGPIHLVREHLSETFLVLNGDIITDLNLRSFISSHRQNGKLITVAMTEKNIETNLGVLTSENGHLTSFREKPIMKLQVSMGIYCLEPGILDLIPKGVPFGFDDLMHTMLEQDLPVHVYRHKGLWMDLGREEDLLEAQKNFHSNHLAMLGV